MAQAFVETWVANFGVSAQITKESGVQLTSNLFLEFNQLFGSAHFRTKAYNPSANDLVEGLHR